MFELEKTGGANIGSGHATWPFAKLSVNKNELRLNASIIGSVYFRPSDVISIELSPRFAGSGIKVNHRVKGYSDYIVFITPGGRDLIAQIEHTGFLKNSGAIPAEVEAEIARFQDSGSFPMKGSAILVFAVIWNLLLLSSMTHYFGIANSIPVWIGAKLALAFAFLFALATLVSGPFSHVVLKDGRTAREIRSFLFFLMFISGFLFTIVSLT